MLELIIIYLIFYYIVIPAYKHFRDKKKEEDAKIQANINARKAWEAKMIRKEELLAEVNFKEKVEFFRPYYRMMALAGGTDPLLLPSIDFEKTEKGRYDIILSKKVYDIELHNFKEYNNRNLSWNEREKAVERFRRDLFGEYTEEMERMGMGAEFIADHIVKIEKERVGTADFILIFDVPAPNDEIERELLEREIEKTQIFYN